MLSTLCSYNVFCTFSGWEGGSSAPFPISELTHLSFSSRFLHFTVTVCFISCGLGSSQVLVLVGGRQAFFGSATEASTLLSRYACSMCTRVTERQNRGILVLCGLYTVIRYCDKNTSGCTIHLWENGFYTAVDSGCRETVLLHYCISMTFFPSFVFVNPHTIGDAGGCENHDKLLCGC